MYQLLSSNQGQGELGPTPQIEEGAGRGTSMHNSEDTKLF